MTLSLPGRAARLLSLLLCLLPAATPATAAPTASSTVTLLIWEDFLAPKVVKALKNEQGIEVRQITFNTADERDALLAKHANEIDLVVADTSALGSYRDRGILQPIDSQKIPNLKHVLTRWQNDMNLAVPYLWGHTGIAWRTDLVKTPITSYAQLFALAKDNPGKVGILDDAHEALMAAEFAFGKAPYELRKPADVAAAHKLLKEHMSGMRVVASTLDETAPLATGAVIATQAYNGDVAYLRDNLKVPLAFAVPSPGCMIWQESFLLLKKAPHKDAAYRFLNSINEPDLAARNATAVRYATSNALAASHLAPEFRNDPIIRPSLEGLDGCYFYPVFSSEVQSAINAINP